MGCQWRSAFITASFSSSESIGPFSASSSEGIGALASIAASKRGLVNVISVVGKDRHTLLFCLVLLLVGS